MSRRSSRVGTISGASALQLALVMCAVVSALVLPASATALGTPIKVGEPGNTDDHPAIAVDGSGTAYVAWAETVHANDEKIYYCVLPSGSSACSHSGSLSPGPAGKEPLIEQVQVLVDGSTIILLANVSGLEDKYEPIEEWTSTDGGATFTAADKNEAVAESPPGIGDTQGLNAVVVPAGNALGYAFDSAVGEPSFDEFPLTSPPECSFAHCPSGDSVAELGSLSLGNEDGVFASQLTTNLGVLGIYEALDSVPGCTFDTDYVYASGAQEANNNYDIPPGSPKSAWKVPLSPSQCEIQYPAVSGGPSGLGMVGTDEQTGTAVYQQFDVAHEDFDTPLVTIANESELSPSVSQDSAGGIYVTYLNGGIHFAYSNTGGASWMGPVTINADSLEEHLVSSVGSDGQGWAAFEQEGSVYVQPFVASEAIPPAPTPVVQPTPTPTPTVTPTIFSPLKITPSSPTISSSTTIEGDNVSLTAPNQCVRNGLINGEAKVTVPSAKRKGRYVVKIYEAIFKVDGTTVTIKRKHLSDAPFKVTIHLKHVKPGTKLVLTVHLLIAVKHGPKRSKTLKVTLTSCA